ncbi:hypothetical protein GCM10018785_66470 [Streptomyces longispororuber]|uniref:DNA-3-methyladenine glycosylase 2 family protein n=1 Tax=Streptomyces longispororuber TaxID=68230 RepID=A0A919DYA9_9ACTN|nr:hypothetical protein [Streptomyces longispororuber]GHE90272.1 hypothetical protein GCM10018785_66470 [Streptomyces longispororuber]
MSTTIITEHPSWHVSDDGTAVRVVEYAGTIWSAHWNATGLTLCPTGTGSTEAPPVARTSPDTLPSHRDVQALVTKLACLGTVQRLTNPSLWDAIATALLRQVVRAGQARKVYRAFCAAYGRAVDTVVGPLAVMPSPEAVLTLSDTQFAAVGAAFNRDALRHAARAYLERGRYWRTLDADSLVKELVSVRRVGPWTAAAAAADHTGDHAVYPHSDLAVRTWARKAAPDLELPVSEAEFAALWRRWAPDRTTLHTLTLLTLTWGTHARPTEHGGNPRHA